MDQNPVTRGCPGTDPACPSALAIPPIANSPRGRSRTGNPGGRGSAHRFRWSEARRAAVVAETKLGAVAPAAARVVAPAGTGSRGIAGGFHSTRAAPGAGRTPPLPPQGTRHPGAARPPPRWANGRGAREAGGGARAAGQPRDGVRREVLAHRPGAVQVSEPPASESCVLGECGEGRERTFRR